MMNEDLLANAIIVRAAKDYELIYRSLKRRYGMITNFPQGNKLNELKRFFGGQYIMMLTSADGPSIVKGIEEKVDEKLYKRWLKHPTINRYERDWYLKQRLS